MEYNLVSIIIPVYNSEQYISKCIDSLINQTWIDIEIIVINDGSTDDSNKLLNYYKNKDSRIKVFYQENSGPSIARNYGIKMATGKYIVFCDSDDTVEKYYIESLVKNIIELNSDIVCCGYTDVSKYGKVKLNDFFREEKLIKKNEFINDIFKGVGGTLWGKIFKKDIIYNHSIKMNPQIYMCEDMVFILEYSMYCKKFAAIPDHLYNYNRLNDSSISSKMSMYYYNNLNKVLKEIERILIQNKFPQNYVDNILRNRVESMTYTFIIMQNDKKHNYSKSDKLKNIETIIENSYFKKYKRQFKSKLLNQKLLLFFLYKNNISVLIYYSSLLYKIQNLKDRIRGIY